MIAKKVLLRYIAPAFFIAVLAVLGWSHNWVYKQGVANAESAAQEVIRKAQAEQRKTADALEQARAERRVEYRERIRTVYIEPDPSGCGDVNVPDGVLHAHGYSTD
jgi:hypothetical protein